MKLASDNKIKILIVDDSEIVRNSLKSFFEEYDFETIVSLDGLDGLKKASEIKPDLIILDLMMPNFDGIKMLQAVKVLDELKDIPVVVISVNTDKRNVLKAMESGADRILTKPVQKDVLIKNVIDILGEESLSRSKRKHYISENRKTQIQSDLIKIFINNFLNTKKNIEEALKNRDKDKLKSIAHELRGNGGTIGYPKLSEICAEIEGKLSLTVVDWYHINLKCEKIYAIVNEIEKLSVIQD